MKRRGRRGNGRKGEEQEKLARKRAAASADAANDINGDGSKPLFAIDVLPQKVDLRTVKGIENTMVRLRHMPERLPPNRYGISTPFPSEPTGYRRLRLGEKQHIIIC